MKIIFMKKKAKPEKSHPDRFLLITNLRIIELFIKKVKKAGDCGLNGIVYMRLRPSP